MVSLRKTLISLIYSMMLLQFVFTTTEAIRVVHLKQSTLPPEQV